MKKIRNIVLVAALLTGFGCGDYLDVVPDNVATIDNAFSDRVQARKYLFTSYSFLPSFASIGGNPAILAGDEFWINGEMKRRHYNIPQNVAQGAQNANNPYINFYEGANGASSSLYQGIRVCNTFIDRIDEVQDIDDYEKDIWKAEAKFLKAYYHFYLLRMYGPIPLLKQNLPVSASPEEVKASRAKFDDCVTYIAGLLDEAAEDLPGAIQNPVEDQGRVTKPIALAVKAKLLVMAASPLFNGNPDYASFTNIDGERFFGEYDNEKWKLAADAALAALQAAEDAGSRFYDFTDDPLGNFSDFTKNKMTLRGRVTERWNPEIIWGDSKGNGSTNTLQRYSQARLISGVFGAVPQALASPLRIARQFYTQNGVPIEEDKDWVGKDVYAFRTATAAEAHLVKEGEDILELHLDREPRFYADLGFDRGVWFGQGRLDENSPYYVYARAGETAGKQVIDNFNITGYYPKKLVNYKNAFSTGNNYSVTNYAFPIVRLADLYLLYAEALNEYQGPSEEVYTYVDKIRERAGLEGVVTSWANYATNPNKPATKEGLREIIQRERLIELVFEGHRFWDLRRWKLSARYMNGPIQGWNVEGETREDFYTLVDLHDQKFVTKDYLWPFKTSILTINTNLVQNPGW